MVIYIYVFIFFFSFFLLLHLELFKFTMYRSTLLCVFTVLQKSSLEVSLEESRAELLALRTDHADTVNNLEAQVRQFVIALLDNTCAMYQLCAIRKLHLNIRLAGNLPPTATLGL